MKMANISKKLVHQRNKSDIKALVDPKLLPFKRVEMGADSNM